MQVTLENPEYFTLIHKLSGRKINTWNCDYIQYNDEKFEKVLPKRKMIQEKLI